MISLPIVNQFLICDNEKLEQIIDKRDLTSITIYYSLIGNDDKAKISINRPEQMIDGFYNSNHINAVRQFLSYLKMDFACDTIANSKSYPLIIRTGRDLNFIIPNRKLQTLETIRIKEAT
jgi:hypothetical protein